MGIAIEAVLTVVLLLTVFGTAVDDRAPKLGGMAIGLAVAADVLFGGPLTGAAMNPARWFGPAVASGFLDNWYVWWVGPLLGAAVAALLYRFVFAEPSAVEGGGGLSPALQEEAEQARDAGEGVGKDEDADADDEQPGEHTDEPMVAS
jgi:hypothetical protein